MKGSTGGNANQDSFSACDKAACVKLVLTEGAKGMKGAIAKAKELAETIPNSFIAGQFVKAVCRR